jgi:hypothetical protein
VSSSEWLGRFAGREIHFIPDDLAKAGQFLVDAHIPGEGWGDYPGVSPNLHPTAQAISALRALRHPREPELASRAAAWAIGQFGDDPPGSGQDIIDLLVVLAASGELASEFVTRLYGVLQGLLGEGTDDHESTRLLAQVILLAEWWPDDHRAVVSPWAEELVRRSRGVHAWHTTAGATDSVPLTAWAVRALTGWRHLPQAPEAIDRGIVHLHECLRRAGRDPDASMSPYVLGLVVRALAGDTGWAPDVTRRYRARLRAGQLPDGGWGAGWQAGVSTEHTGMAVVALVESGCCRYMPSEDARDLVTELEQVTKRLHAMEQNKEATIRADRTLATERSVKKQASEQEFARILDRRELDQGLFMPIPPQPPISKTAHNLVSEFMRTRRKTPAENWADLVYWIDQHGLDLPDDEFLELFQEQMRGRGFSWVLIWRMRRWANAVIKLGSAERGFVAESLRREPR